MQSEFKFSLGNILRLGLKIKSKKKGLEGSNTEHFPRMFKTPSSVPISSFLSTYTKIAYLHLTNNQ